MNKDEQINLEILSKIVIQLKTAQVVTANKTKELLNNIKTEMTNEMLKLREQFNIEVNSLKDEINEIKSKEIQTEKNNYFHINEVKLNFEKSNLELREDMLKLLKKYEDKFDNQDDEIDELKSKCEMVQCQVCNFKSFKIHFFKCGECNSNICSDCVKACKTCSKSQCLTCLIKCNTCKDMLCKHFSLNCVNCNLENCRECFDKCISCNVNHCKKCLLVCTNCKELTCYPCSSKCEKCNNSVCCKNCLKLNAEILKCICGRLYCQKCEEDCSVCTIPCLWQNENRSFKGFHAKSSVSIPDKCLIKFFVINKGIDTSHLGLTTDVDLKSNERATENFWSLCLNSGEKFSTSDYKKKGSPWAKYSVTVIAGDTIYIKFIEGELSFMINNKEYPVAFNLDKNGKYFLYCLTHDDFTEIEIKSLKVYK